MSKLGKVAGGVGLIGVSLYILVSDGLAVTSMGAVVNARVSVVRAPIDGMLDLVPRPIGGHIRAGEPLGSITDERADDARLLDLERAAAAIESDIGRLRSQIESIRHSRAELQRQAAAYNEGRTRQLKARIEETRALLSAAKARAKESVSALSRAEKLRQQGVQSVALMEKAQADRDVNSLDAEAASARLEGLRIELDAAMRGTFLGDSYNDVPYSSQRTQELELRAAELRGCEFLPVAVWAEI
jgi:multidrug resistance efflux pump